MTFVFGNILAALMVKCINGRLSILIGDIIISGSIAVTYFTASSLNGMILTYGAISGIGCGISYILPMSIAIKWFPKNQSTAAGTVLAGYGLSAVVFNVVITRIINPYNTELDSESGFLNHPEVLDNVPSTFWKVGLIYFSMQIVGLLLIKEVPNDKMDEFDKLSNPTDDEHEDEDMVYSPLDDIDDINMSVLSNHNNRRSYAQSNFGDSDKVTFCSCFDGVLHKLDLMVLKEPIFWNLWFTTFFSQMTLIYFSSQWKTFTNQQLGLEDDAMLSYMGSFSAIANASARPFWGFVRDKSTYIKTMSIMTLIDCLLLCSWPSLVYMFTNESLLTLCANLWLAAIFFCQIGIYNIMVQRLSELYGVDRVNYYHGLLVTNQIPAAIFSALVFTEMREFLGWIGMSLVMGSFQFIAFCLVLSSKICNKNK